MARPLSTALAALAAALLALIAAQTASAHATGLKFVAPEELALTGSDDGTVWLRNNSDSAVEPRFTASVEDSDGNEVSRDTLRVVLVDEDGNGIPANEIEPLDPQSVVRYRLHLEGSAVKRDLSGELEVIYIPAIAAVALIVVSWVVAVVGESVSLDTPLPTLDFDSRPASRRR